MNRIINFILIPLFTFLFFSCRDKASQNQAKPESEPNRDTVLVQSGQAKQIGLKTMTLSTHNLPDEWQVHGWLDVPPQNIVMVSSPAAAFVKETKLLQGMHIHKGDLICALESPGFLEMQQEYASNHVRLAFLETEAQRQQDLVQGNATSMKNAQESQMEYQMLKSRQGVLGKKLEWMGFSLRGILQGRFVATLDVRATMDGYITESFVHPGQHLELGKPICEITNLDHIHAELMVFESDLGKLREGQPLRFSVAGFPEKEYQASVYLINQKVQSDRTVRVHAHIQNITPSLLPNMQIVAIVQSGTRDVLAVPDNALVVRDKLYGVFLQAGQGRFVFQQVQKGANQGGWTEISFPKGISAADRQVVVQGAYDLMGLADNVEEE
jgi:cobalt-zinc-cadmium efflux system membrane fusion protein